MFYNRATKSDANIRAAESILLHPFRYSKATKEAAVDYLNNTYDPRKLPVPLKYREVAEALGDPWKWLKRKLEENQIPSDLT